MSKNIMISSTGSNMLLSSSSVFIHGFNEEKFSRSLGRILTHTDTLGLPSEQAKAFKDLLKQEIWDLWEHPAFVEEKDYEGGSGKLA